MIDFKASNIHDIINRLDPVYKDQVKRAGPIMATLRLGAHLVPVQSPPAPSPVAAHLLAAQFTSWPDVNRHLKELRSQGSKVMGAPTYDAWARRIADFCSDPQVLLAYTVPLLVEGQMNAIASSPGRAQDVLLAFLAPILESDAPLREDPSPRSPQGPENASIYAILIAGTVPFLLTCHETATISHWRSHLEAATVLLLPQVVIRAEQVLSRQPRNIMRQALDREVRGWRVSPPKLGDQREWEWLPKLM